MEMKTKSRKQYLPPRQLQEVGVELENSFVASVPAKALDIRTTGQEIEGFYDLEEGSTYFEQEWGN